MSDGTFVAVRDMAVAIGRTVAAIDPELIDQAIAEGNHSLAVGPILDPTLYRNASAQLDEQLRYLAAFRDFRRAIEDLRRPQASVTNG